MKQEDHEIIENNPLIVSYKFLEKNKTKTIIYWILAVLTLGLTLLFEYWFPDMTFLLYDEKSEFTESTHICLMKEHSYEIIEIKTQKIIRTPHEEKKFESYFKYDYCHYTFNEEKRTFINFESEYFKKMTEDKKNQEHIECLTNEDAVELKKVYGNNIIKIEHEPIWLTLVKSICSPLNIYELCLIGLTIYFDNWGFAGLLIFYVIIQVLLDLWSIREKIDKINSLSASTGTVNVIRKINNVEARIVIPSEDIVIGDIILIRPKQNLKCDVMLIKGSCLINQAVLTGESMPITKTEINPNEKVSDINFIYAGSDCVMLRAKEVKGLVVNTAWSTYKGKLVGKLLNTKYKQFKFEKDIKTYVLILLIIFTFFGALLFYLDIKNGVYETRTEVLRFLEIITCAAPPSLFFAFAVVSRMISNRLKEDSIFCLLPDKIKECGRIKTICFDKTGTLTENEIKINGFVMAREGEFETVESDINELINCEGYRYLMETLSCCNNLNLIKGEIIGDPIEEQMFEKTLFKFTDTLQISYISADEEANRYEIVPTKEYKKFFKLPNNFSYTIYKTIQFDSNRKRMSTVIMNEKTNDHKFTVLSKGAPEVMKKICDPATIPSDYEQVLNSYSEQGLRILGLAYNKFNDVPGTAKEIEKDLTFLGFLMVNNPIKKESEPTISRLKHNGIECNMITGDNLYTGINVGIQVGLIEPSQNIWVGQFVEEKYIKWTFFNNNEVMMKLDNRTLKKTVEDHSVLHSNLMKSIVKVEEMTTIGYQEINKVLENIENSNTVLAVDGNSFDDLLRRFEDNQELLFKILEKIKIYGRAKPLQKQNIVLKLKEKHEKEFFCVGFVGDGANDSQALHASNMGLSIGNNDSSIASSFSTYKDNISPVVDIIEEGKFLLENSIQIFKLTTYMGIMESTGIVILAYYQMSFTVPHYTFGILFWIPNFILMSFQRPVKLNQFYPKPGLVNKKIILGLIYGVTIMLTFMGLMAYFLFYRSQAKPFFHITKDINLSKHSGLAFIEPLLVFFFHSSNNIFYAFAINRGYPFKQPFWTNYRFMIYNICVYLFLLILLFSDLFEEYFFGKFLIKLVPLPLVSPDLRLKFLALSLLFNFTNPFFEMTLNNIFLISKFKKLQNNLCKKEVNLSVSNVSHL
jgi:cation-transporting ATPase 13A2